MEKKKGSLSTVFLLIAIILIVAMGALLYMQKTEADKKITELENSINEIKEATNKKVPNIKDEEVDIKDNENESLNSEEVKLLAIKFLEMIYESEGSFEGVLKIIGYDNVEEIYNNAVQSYNNGDSIYGSYDTNTQKNEGGYYNTKIKYADFEEKISNYMTPEIVEKCFGKKFVEHNGFLYATIGRTSGAEVSNVNIEVLSKNVYSVKYSLLVSGAAEESHCIIRITNYNNKNVVSEYYK